MNNQETFTLEEENENNERKHELIELVRSGEAILIVGAGSSRRVGYPGWTGLLTELENLANEYGVGVELDKEKCEVDSLEYLKYAEDVKSYICNQTGNLEEYYALLEDLFSPKDPPCTDFHRRLVLLPFRGILTTNYDLVLEAALGEIEQASAYDNSLIIDRSSAGRVHEFLMAMNKDKRTTRRIAHLHGKFDSADRIILSVKDYERAYGLDLTDEENHRENESKLRFKLLWAVLATRRVVFIGFSMDDPYFNKMLEIVSADLRRWRKSVHFAIMSISPNNDKGSKDSVKDSKDKAERLKNRYGVDTVFYEDSDGSHLHLNHIVTEIAEKCGVEVQSTIIPQEQPDNNDRSVDEQPESVASESEDESDWLEQANQRMERRIDHEN